jgi:hypothetical protein
MAHPIFSLSTKAETRVLKYKHDDAIKWFSSAHSEFPEKKDGEQGYYYVGYIGCIQNITTIPSHHRCALRLYG